MRWSVRGRGVRWLLSAKGNAKIHMKEREKCSMIKLIFVVFLLMECEVMRVECSASDADNNKDDEYWSFVFSRAHKRLNNDSNVVIRGEGISTKEALYAAVPFVCFSGFLYVIRSLCEFISLLSPSSVFACSFSLLRSFSFSVFFFFYLFRSVFLAQGSAASLVSFLTCAL